MTDGDALVDDKESEIQELKPLLTDELAADTARKPRTGKRKVRWNDRHGRKLVEVLEFQPSDHSESESEEHADSCICSMM